MNKELIKQYKDLFEREYDGDTISEEEISGLKSKFQSILTDSISMDDFISFVKFFQEIDDDVEFNFYAGDFENSNAKEKVLKLKNNGYAEDVIKWHEVFGAYNVSILDDWITIPDTSSLIEESEGYHKPFVNLGYRVLGRDHGDAILYDTQDNTNKFKRGDHEIVSDDLTREYVDSRDFYIIETDGKTFTQLLVYKTRDFILECLSNF